MKRKKLSAADKTSGKFLGHVAQGDCMCWHTVCPGFPAQAFITLVRAYCKGVLKQDKECAAQVGWQLLGWGGFDRIGETPEERKEYINVGWFVYQQAVLALHHMADRLENDWDDTDKDSFPEFMRQAGIVFERFC